MRGLVEDRKEATRIRISNFFYAHDMKPSFIKDTAIEEFPVQVDWSHWHSGSGPRYNQYRSCLPATMGALSHDIDAFDFGSSMGVMIEGAM